MSTGLYVDPDSGQNISTNSMLKTFLRCPKQAEYKYHRRLKPKSVGRPLSMGKWMHSLLEAYYKELGGFDTPEWQEVHQSYVRDFSKLFDEEKEKLGDLPRDCVALMKSYLWHYKTHEVKVLGVEQMIETEFPDGSIFRGKYDMLIEDEYGLWLWDHKNYKKFPNFLIAVIDTQAPRYVWAARKEGIPVQGFIWNYLKTKPMTKPEMILSGARLSKTSMKNCDFPMAARALKEYKLDIEPYKPWLRSLKAQRYQHGEPQTSPFFQRLLLEPPEEMLDQVATSSFHTSMRMHDYNFEVTEAVERVPDRNCEWMCSYPELCKTELYGGNTDLILRKQYGVGDPMDYYYDDREPSGRGED